MKKQLLMIGGGFDSFWNAVTPVRQNLGMLAIHLVTEKNSRMDNFLTPVDNVLAHKDTGSSPDQFHNERVRKDGSPLPESTQASLTFHTDWMDEDTSQGGEFLDDAVRVKDQPLRLHK